MRRLMYASLGILLLPAVLHAGRLYGSVTAEGKGVPNTAIEIDCRGNVTKGTTLRDGSYRVDVAKQGKCIFTLVGHKGRPSAAVFSYPDPSQYNFQVVNTNGRYTLRRR